MLKNLNDKDKRKVYSLITIAGICVVSLVLLSCFPSSKSDKQVGKTETNKNAEKQVTKEQEKDDLESKLTDTI